MSRFAGLPFIFLLGALSCWAILADRSGASSPNVPSAAAAVVSTDEATLTPTLEVASPTLTATAPALTDTTIPTATATATRRYVDAVSGTRAKIMDTRKTLPGLRIAQTRPNPYRFISEQARNASFTYGVHSVCVLAVKPHD